MVWKDQVNVLDQGRIFRLLSKGPRLDSYLRQIQRADKLDFASWGGFAQNFAARRVPFEHPECAKHWEKLPPEHLHIPTFVTGLGGPFVPGSALKGALRTSVVHEARDDSVIDELVGREDKSRPPRHPGQRLEERSVGNSSRNRLRVIAPADSDPAPAAALKIYMLRTTTLEVRGPGKIELRWKRSPSGSVEAGRPDNSTPVFAEMAAPGAAFEGRWAERDFYRDTAISKLLGWKKPLATSDIFRAANSFAATVLAAHRQYAAWTGLTEVEASVQGLEARLAEASQRADACLLAIGWGGGFLSKTASRSTSDPAYRQLLREFPFYAKAIRAELPFPKTRRIVFLNNRPATLPGWALLELVPDPDTDPSAS
jgi:CRISPR-associated protein Csm5